MDIERQFSKIAFIFLIFVVISGGFVQDILSCQMQSWLTNSLYARHIIGVIMIFVFIMLEGGWDMDKENEEAAPNDWSSGNTVHSFLYASAATGTLAMEKVFNLTPLFSYYINTYGLPEYGKGFDPERLSNILNILNENGINPYE